MKKQLRLIGASIRDIGDLSYSISDGTGEVVSFPVSFSYHYYEDSISGGGNPFG